MTSKFEPDRSVQESKVSSPIPLVKAHVSKQEIALYDNMEECDNFSDSGARPSGFVLRDRALQNP